ncbi:MAG TPA: DUF2255 family protein [Myxococcota bacterium]|nr:DUF2255 family protein [Myxococcota bacterium]
MVLLRWLVRLVLVVAIGVGALALVARFLDGPLGPLPGGPLRAGPLVSDPVADWSFAAGEQEVELQLDSQRTSRTTWILVHEGRAYVPASTEFPPGKTWHRAALEDGRATLRIAGQRYPVTLEKVDDPALATAVRAVAEAKYPQRPGGEVWLFSVASPSPLD